MASIQLAPVLMINLLMWGIIPSKTQYKENIISPMLASDRWKVRNWVCLVCLQCIFKSAKTVAKLLAVSHWRCDTVNQNASKSHYLLAIIFVITLKRGLFWVKSRKSRKRSEPHISNLCKASMLMCTFWSPVPTSKTKLFRPASLFSFFTWKASLNFF